ncbi:MAG: hypothetical protein ACODAJ_17150 [Planctomycetota bacterium]
MSASLDACPLALIGRRRGRRGAIAAEMALLVFFVYVPLTIGALHVAWLAAGRQRVHEANHFALFGHGDQSEELAERGPMEREFFGEFTGSTDVTEEDTDEPDVPMYDELREMWEEFRKPIHYRNVSAHGSFHLVGNRVVYRESVHVDEGFRVRPEGQCVNEWNLLADNIPENVTELLQDYMVRRQAHSFYQHHWIHDRDEAIRGGGGVRGLTIQVPVSEAAEYWTPQCAVRFFEQRQARDSRPPGLSQRQVVGTPNQFPDAEPSLDYWHPCDGPTVEPEPPAEP